MHSHSRIERCLIIAPEGAPLLDIGPALKQKPDNIVLAVRCREG
ncbi:MAG: hypothetical protein WAU49_14210 [Steroidobacteraceae bacterium]